MPVPVSVVALMTGVPVSDEELDEQPGTDRRAEEDEDHEHPAVQGHRRQAGEQRADVATERQARAEPHQQTAQDGGGHLFAGLYFLINKIAGQFIKTLPSVAPVVGNYAWIISGLLALGAAFEIHKALHPRRRK